MRIIRIAAIAFIIIMSIIAVKYKVQYQVSVNDKVVGYVDSQKNIGDYVDETISKKEDQNIAFVDWKQQPTLQLKLVNRDIEDSSQEIKEEIAEQLNIEYTNFAISINGENKTFVASKDEAETIVEDLKKEYAEKYTKTIGILQVYSENAEEIEAEEQNDAKKIIGKILNDKKQADIKAERERKLAIAKAKTKAVAKVTATATTETVPMNGIKIAVRPVTGKITSRFGRRSSPGGIGSTYHKGLDIAAPAGTPVYAVAAGTVTYAGYKGALGKLVIINHGNGVQTYYGHCNSIYVSNGQKVQAGTNIATVGKTGSATGFHLHFEIHINGTVVNPQNYIY